LYLSRLTRDSLLQRLDLDLRQPLASLAVFLLQQHLLLELPLRLGAGLGRCRVRFLLEPCRKLLRLLPEPGQLFFPLLQGGFPLLPALLQSLLLLQILPLLQAQVFVVFILRLLAFESLLVLVVLELSLALFLEGLFLFLSLPLRVGHLVFPNRPL